MNFICGITHGANSEAVKVEIIGHRKCKHKGLASQPTMSPGLPM